MHDTSEEEDEESSPVLTQAKNTKASSGASPPPYGQSGFDRGGTSSSGASGVGAPTAPLNVNKNGKKDSEEDNSNGKDIRKINMPWNFCESSIINVIWKQVQRNCL